MMNVGSTNLLGLPGSLTAAATTEGKSKSIDAVETVSKDEFLRLLVAQLKNQNPLEPVKNENFLAQLATFSSLEQLVAIKKGIDKLIDTTADETTDTTAIQTQS